MERGAAAAAVGRVETSRRVAEGRAGWERWRGGKPADPQTLFDLASLTKPFVASLALALDRQGELPLALRVGEVWPGAHRRLARRRLASLLRHTAGFQAWTPLYRRCRSAREAAALLVGGELLGARPGTYSDLGYILWGLTAERALGRSLAELLAGELLGPLGAAGAVSPGGTSRAAECPVDGSREARLAAAQGLRIRPWPAPPPGVPQDGNARFLGGLGGHAGLFAPVGTLIALGREWLGPGRVLTAEAAGGALRGPFPLGWWRRGRAPGGGKALGPGAFGHSGFTGGTFWVDPRRRRVAALLAHRASAEIDLEPLQRRFLETAAAL